MVVFCFISCTWINPICVGRAGWSQYCDIPNNNIAALNRMNVPEG
ncbi:hypothetical protein HanXRQr2_Chr07g0283331 [Helianthus annuus]|uniref:Uncharacterized protein n=1 Tax=Helianthus annuus TaxID=4232 RepID=A0A9K3IJG0_HELAN|nr:hypothetical protein HanXRQr2_Chr07g0283331 [Helianthus annuus]KAJ0903802.1 hypothetical protein HanPSC8_Chr07g0274181 [Helianthus annuus]